MEADVLYDESKHSEPIMAHPPDDQSDLTFKQFMQLAAPARKGIKLDFKSPSALEPCLSHLNQIQPQINFPVILNADVLQGHAAPSVKIDADTFVSTCVQFYPDGVLSIGWTTRPCDETEYTWENIREGVGLCERFGLAADRLHFAVRLSWSLRSLDKLAYLHEKTKCGLTVWSHATDRIHPAESMLLLREYFAPHVVYYDLPEEQLDYFNANKSNYKTVLLASTSSFIRDHMSR
jgi:hypothetical protein